jgi:hypothetical protein
MTKNVDAIRRLFNALNEWSGTGFRVADLCEFAQVFAKRPDVPPICS